MSQSNTSLDELMAGNLKSAMLGLPKVIARRILESAKPWASGEKWYDLMIASLDEIKRSKPESEIKRSTRER